MHIHHPDIAKRWDEEARKRNLKAIARPKKQKR